MCGTCADHNGGHDHSHEHSFPVHVPDEGVRVVVVGKGGVGKSTLTALLARVMARSGGRTIAIDADEQRNLAMTLGMGLDETSAIVPVASAADYVEEKTGARPGEGAGGMLRLNPDTSDVIDRLGVVGPDGVRLLVMGGVQQAGSGCLCPENAILAATIADMHLRRGDVVVMDTHAGVEHFGRAVARGFDVCVVLVDPTFNAIQVGLESARLARQLGIEQLHLVVNRTRSDDDIDTVKDRVGALGGFPFTSVHGLPYDERALLSEPSVEPMLDGSSPLAEAAAHLVDHLVARAEVYT